MRSIPQSGTGDQTAAFASSKGISIGKIRTADFPRRDRIRHAGDDSYGKDADRKIGGPRCSLRAKSAGIAKSAESGK
jgi:hypothetical protein